jgi:hypothetical protein
VLCVTERCIFYFVLQKDVYVVQKEGYFVPKFEVNGMIWLVKNK